MKKLLNTLYINSEDKYLTLDGENVVIKESHVEIGRVPLHNLEAIVTCGYVGVSPALMGACAERNVMISFMTPYGRFLARVVGTETGNVIVRKTHYQYSEDKDLSLQIAKNFIIGKLYNSRWVIERATRDHALQVDVEKLKKASENIQGIIKGIADVDNMDSLRGMEGKAADYYFSVFGDLIFQQREDFIFNGRNRRPPLDNVNAMLSFAYSLLESMCFSALEMVGLDPYVGFMHTIRPGRKSLALDLMEELRSVFADRFVLSMINRREITGRDFVKCEDGAVKMKDDARKVFLNAWQTRKQDVIVHPFLKEKVEWGMIPYIQALLLTRFIRGDLDAYPPFLWK